MTCIWKPFILKQVSTAYQIFCEVKLDGSCKNSYALGRKFNQFGDVCFSYTKIPSLSVHE